MKNVITKCKIENYLADEHQKAINVTFDDGTTEQPLTTFFENEVTFIPEEFLGKTREEAYEYVMDKRKSFITRSKREDTE